MHKHLFIAPFPPVDGGITLLSKELVEYIDKSESITIKTIDINFQKSFLDKIKNIFLAFINIPFHAFYSNSISMHLTERSVLLIGVYTCVICKIFNKPLIFRKFAGSFDLALKKNGFFYRSLASFVIRNSFCLLETKYLVSLFKEKYPKEKIREFANHRSFNKIISEKKIRQDDVVKFVFVGQVKRTKGINEIIKAVDMLNNQGYEDKYRFDVFGPCESKDIENGLMRIKNINYMGAVDNQYLIEQLSAYDALVLPTYHEGEGIPGVIIEAMANGLVPIVSDWRSVREAVPESVDLTVKVKDAKSLFNVLEKYIENASLYRSYADDMKKSAEYFSTEKWGDEFIKIIFTVKT